MSGLIIDTSKEFCLLALIEKNFICNWEVTSHGNQLSTYLLPAIHLLLNDKKKLDFIAVGTGPGSFTGTRIGVAVAKGLSYGWHIPLIGFNSSLAYTPEAKRNLLALLNEKFQLKNYTFEGNLPLIYSHTP